MCFKYTLGKLFILNSSQSRMRDFVVNKNEMEQQDLLYVLLGSDYMLHKLFLQHFVSEKTKKNKKKNRREKQNVNNKKICRIKRKHYFCR